MKIFGIVVLLLLAVATAGDGIVIDIPDVVLQADCSLWRDTRRLCKQAGSSTIWASNGVTATEISAEADTLQSVKNRGRVVTNATTQGTSVEICNGAGANCSTATGVRFYAAGTGDVRIEAFNGSTLLTQDDAIYAGDSKAITIDNGSGTQVACVTIDDAGKWTFETTESCGFFSKVEAVESQAADPADSGVLRCGNNEVCMAAEAATPGTDLTLKWNTSNQLESSAMVRLPTSSEATVKFGCLDNDTVDDTNYVLSDNGNATCSTSENTNSEWPAPFNGIVDRFVCKGATPPGAGQTFTYTVRVNRAATDFTCVVSETDQACSDTSGSSSFLITETIGVEQVASSGAADAGATRCFVMILRTS